MNYKPKKDGYSKSRGAAQFYIISCAGCGVDILLYQKDGPGGLVRMYRDRITAPAELADKSDLPALRCQKCNEIIAMPMIYVAEKRQAYRIIPGKIKKTKNPGAWPD